MNWVQQAITPTEHTYWRDQIGLEMDVTYAIVVLNSPSTMTRRQYECIDDQQVVDVVRVYRFEHESVTVYYEVRSGRGSSMLYSEKVVMAEPRELLNLEWLMGVAA